MALATHADFTTAIASQVRAFSGKNVRSATAMEYWQGTAAAVVDHLAENRQRFYERHNASRMQHYFSAEFLMGRALLNNLGNLGMVDAAAAALGEFGQNLSDVLEEEHDAALGNGGLGRLAACFLDSSATQNLPVRGYGILYRYGLFGSISTTAPRARNPIRGWRGGLPVRHPA